MVNNETFSINNQKIFDIIVCRAKESASTELDGETVILDIASGIYSGLDLIGTFIWNQMERPLSVGALRDSILERYEVSEEKCTADLLIFLKDLADHGLICINDETID
jgi:Coenzyme PQQ synthesis protein D (PqqD)